MIKHVIFDFDGTLADSKLVFISAFNSLAEKYNYKKINVSELDSLKKLSIIERAQILNFPMYKLPIIAPQLFKVYRQTAHQIELFDGVKELLEAINKLGYEIAIISSNSKENIIEILQRNNISQVKTILTSSRIFGKDKLIKRYLRKHRLNSAEVIYIGDEQRDLVACKKTGIKMIWVSWGYDAIEVMKAMTPDYIVHTPAEILQILK